MSLCKILEAFGLGWGRCIVSLLPCFKQGPLHSSTRPRIHPLPLPQPQLPSLPTYLLTLESIKHIPKARCLFFKAQAKHALPISFSSTAFQFYTLYKLTTSHSRTGIGSKTPFEPQLQPQSQHAHTQQDINAQCSKCEVVTNS